MARDSGIGTYIRHLLPLVIAARPQWRFTLLGHAAGLKELAWDRLPNVAIRDCRARIYTVSEQFELWRATPRDADLFWSPHYNIPLLHRGTLAVTVHDVFHLAMPDLVRGPLQRAYARGMFNAVQQRADVVITVSDFSRTEYRRVVGAAGPEPIVVHNGVGGAWLHDVGEGQPRAQVERPYALFVGNVKPHKNLRTLVRAFAQVVHTVPHDLVIVGRREGLRGGDGIVEREAEALGPRVRFTGEVSDAALHDYVRRATALVFPSLYEGFGLPPLEAMAAGCPTLVARSGALPEICGDAALYCDPRDASDIAGQLRTLLTDDALRATLRERGRQQAGRFTWEQSARETLAALESVL